jgi:hypothetical protein
MVGKSVPYQSFPVWFVQPKLQLLEGGGGGGKMEGGGEDGSS